MVLAQYGLNDRLAVAGAEVLKRKPALDASMPSAERGSRGIMADAVTHEGAVCADGVELGYAVYENGAAAIVRCAADAPCVAVPCEVEGRPVMGIGAHAFSTCYSLQEVLLPETVAELGEYAFMNCALRRFEAPAGLRVIGRNAFYKCKYLEQVRLNAGLRSIGESAFRETALAALHVPPGVTRIGIDAFRETRLVFGGEASTLVFGGSAGAPGPAGRTPAPGGSAGAPGQACQAPTPGAAEGANVRIAEGGDGVATPGGGRGTFELLGGALYQHGPEGLELLQLLDDGLARYTGPEGLVKVGAHAFAGKKKLEEAVFPEGLLAIGECAFKGCAALGDVGLPDTLREVGKDAFRGTALRRLRVPAALRNLGLTAFYTGGSVAARFRRTIEEVRVAPGNDRFYVADDMLCERRGDEGDLVLLYTGTAEEIVIPRSVTGIGSYAFLNVTGARRLVLHSGVTSIDVGGFDFGSALAEIVYDDVRTGERWVVRYPPGEQGRRALWLTFGGGDFDVAFAYDAADNAVLAVHDAYVRSRAMVERLCDPVLFEEKTAAEYRKRLLRALSVVAVEFGRNGYLQGVDKLYDLGLLTDANIDGCIRAASDAGEVALLSRLMEIKRARFGAKLFDFDL